MKVLCQVYTRAEVDELLPLIEPLEGHGFEVAFGTFNKDLLPYLSSERKVLVVMPKTYDYDLSLTAQDVMKPSGFNVTLRGQDLSEVFEEIMNGITKGTCCNNCV